MICTKCGHQLTADASFCPACGQPVEKTAPNQYPEQQDQQAIPATGERVFMVLTTNRKYSMFKMTPCYIVFMQDRLILAHLSKERRKLESNRLSQEIKASGKGFFKGSAAMMRYWSHYHEKYYEMSSGQILSEDEGNALIYYDSIAKFLFHAYNSSLDTDGTERSTGGKLNISLADGKTMKFTHNIGRDRTIKDTLTQLLGKKLKYKR